METRYEWMGVQGEWFHRKLPVHLTYNLVRNGCSTAAVAAPSLQDDAWSRLSHALMPYGLGAACKCPYSMLAESQLKTGVQAGGMGGQRTCRVVSALVEPADLSGPHNLHPAHRATKGSCTRPTVQSALNLFSGRHLSIICFASSRYLLITLEALSPQLADQPATKRPHKKPRPLALACKRLFHQCLLGHRKRRCQGRFCR